jgi:hypothetical protein
MIQQRLQHEAEDMHAVNTRSIIQSTDELDVHYKDMNDWLLIGQ